MLAWIMRWLDRRTLKEQLEYAGAHFALAMAAGDMKRVARLRLIIDDLERQLEVRN